ncbi:MAG: anti-sigma factor, partial [Deltaproteobacteria bacterium]|nr:anti-sigma factor [Deltaproteobacteria bacterium]
MLSNQSTTITALIILLVGMGCGDDSSGPDGGTDGSTDAGSDGALPDTGNPDATTGSMLTIGNDGLEDLGADYVYEGWLITADGPVTTGTFSVDAEGVLSQSEFPLDAATEALATAFVVTIEPADDPDPAPSAVHIVAGDYGAGIAIAEIGHAGALATDFSSAEADFILATPSSSATDDDNQGIWYLVPGAAPSAGLTLPALPEGWTYEGWVVGADGPVSTGTFTAADMADSDGAGPAAGDGDAPPFPGQDFIDPAKDLADSHVAVISVEPVPDNSPAP